MLIDEIIAQIEEGGPRGYYYFETFILHLLKYHLEKQGKALQVERSHNIAGDAFVPTGFDGLEGPVLIEIKLSVSSGMTMSRLQHLALMVQNNTETARPISTFLVISARPVAEKNRNLLRESFSRFKYPFKLVIWGPDDVNRVAEQHKEKVYDIARNLFTLRLETVASQPLRDWKAEREEIVEKLGELYRNGQFSLFLGAGVSSSAGMPDWNKLLNSLFVTYLAQQLDPDDDIDDGAISELVSRLNAVDEPSTLMAARYLRRGLTGPGADTKAFTAAITKSLYSLRNTSLPIHSPLIAAIAALCMPRRTGARVRSVVTYNFDDLLERQLDEKSILHRCIYTQNETNDPDELPVYHVHGFVPENAAGYEDLDSSTLVFSEEGYHKIYSDAYHWSNLVQLNNLRENHCLMVGLSMTDPNLRRLLDIAARSIERSKHFAFMKRLTEDRFCFENDPVSGVKVAAVSDLNSAREFLERHHRLNEELMKELGVIVIWYEDYDDIPSILKRIADY
jgi:hypothetical protein